MELKERLNRAFELLARIPVSGDLVEIMFQARQELRAAYKQLEEAETDG